MDRSWQDALSQIGVLHETHLKEYWQMTLADIPLDNDIILYRQAIWQRSFFGQGAQFRHRILVAEIFLALSPWIEEWARTDRTDASLSRPDAVLQLAGLPGQIWLEADTGKENRAQWKDKLVGYWVDPPPRDTTLLIVAQGGGRRLQRLDSWIRESSIPIPWTLVPTANLRTPPEHWEWIQPSVPPVQDGTPSPSKDVIYCTVHGEPITSLQAEQGLAEKRYVIQARQIQSNRDIFFLREVSEPRRRF